MMERVALSAGRCGSECVEYSNKKEKVEEWRSSCAEHANRYLENWKPISFFIT